jgi:hypothetical protein
MTLYETRRWRYVLDAVLFVGLVGLLNCGVACNHPTREDAYDAVNKADCLPSIKLTD